MFRYFTMFILITLLGYLYERYKYKQESNEELAKYDMVKKFFLGQSAEEGNTNEIDESNEPIDFYSFVEWIAIFVDEECDFYDEPPSG